MAFPNIWTISFTTWFIIYISQRRKGIFKWFQIVPASDQFTISRNLRRRITKFRNETKDYNKPILKSYDEDKEEFAWEIDGDNPDLSPLIQELNEEIRVRNGNVDHDEGPSEEKKEDKKEKKE